MTCGWKRTPDTIIQEGELFRIISDGELSELPHTNNNSCNSEMKVEIVRGDRQVRDFHYTHPMFMKTSLDSHGLLADLIGIPIKVLINFEELTETKCKVDEAIKRYNIMIPPSDVYISKEYDYTYKTKKYSECPLYCLCSKCRDILDTKWTEDVKDGKCKVTIDEWNEYLSRFKYLPE